MFSYRRQSALGFTILELAVVLTVIALIVGGLFQGQSLLQKSKLQSVVSDFLKYSDAYRQFKTAYGCKPGDMGSTSGIQCTRKASTTWSTAVDTGDGNGYIAGPCTAGAIDEDEIFGAWQQLANAKLINGIYTGAAVGGGASIGVNVPSSRIAAGSYMFLSVDDIDASVAGPHSSGNCSFLFYGNYGTYNNSPGSVIIFGAIPSGGLPNDPVLTPKDAYFIDNKIDEGLPAVGKISTFLAYPSGVANNCVVNNVSGPAVDADDGRDVTYNTAVTDPSCSLIYVNDSTQIQ